MVMGLLNKKQKDLLNLVRQDLNEATSTNSGSGRFTIPMSPGIRLFKDKQLQPFVVPTSKYDDAELAYDSYDGSLDVSKSQAKKMETNARKISKYIKNHPSNNDDDGDILNQSTGKIMESDKETMGSLIKELYPIIIKKAGVDFRSGYYPSVDDARRDIIKKIKEGDDDTLSSLERKCSGMYKQQFLNAIEMIRKLKKNSLNEISSSESSGEYSGPIEIGLKKWRESELKPFTNFSSHHVNKKKKQKTMKNNIKKEVGVWEKGKDGSYEIPTHDVHTLKEDLAVWFGTKKKPKGSKQPKGPWVNICRKVDGKHPPCGRPEAKDKGYPKCRAAGVASKMSDSQKKSACAQKRRVEKTHSKTGTGNKPKMASYKPRNESNFSKMIKDIIKESTK